MSLPSWTKNKFLFLRKMCANEAYDLRENYSGVPTIYKNNCLAFWYQNRNDLMNKKIADKYWAPFR